jgi:hypothetical protein
MFGFLNPRTQHLSYRSLYSRGCQHLKLSYGVRSLVFHSFESVFLYGYAADVGAFDRKKVPASKCCKLQASKTLLDQEDRVYGEFTSSLSMLLTSIKLEDDIIDNNSMLARTAKFGLKNQFKNRMLIFLVSMHGSKRRLRHLFKSITTWSGVADRSVSKN